MEYSNTRRTIIRAAAGLGVAAITPLPAIAATLTRTIPSSGETIPAIGMGTWVTFNVGNNASLRGDRCEVLRTFFDLGGRMVDSSPMYGSAEEVVGYCTSQLDVPGGYLPATKVWSDDRLTGRQQIAASYRLWGVEQFGVYQVHNLAGWRQHLPYLHELKEADRIRYTGITTSHGRRHRELAAIMESEQIDFVQLTYNLQDREAEQRLLPLARERGIGVIANRPFRRGALFDRLKGQALPDWAADIQCENMAQIMLKFIVSHPAITCAIPATSSVEHMRENMAAMEGDQPDAGLRGTMADWFDRL